ncbi:MAG: ATP-binding protein [Corynebacterium sp.]|nr:ATP-binding protein [Corynebacterium sp.]
MKYTANKSLSLTLRLLSAQVTVVLFSLLVAGAVASIVGPLLFQDHMAMFAASRVSEEYFHAEQAYRDANSITVIVALTVALLCAVVASLWLSSKLRTPLHQLTKAAAAVQAGHYNVQVPEGNAGPEIATLAQAFNAMASRLDNMENTRRQLLSDLAHELSTPVSVLSVYLDGLEDGVVEWDESTHEVMSDQLARVKRLVNDINEVSRAQEQQLKLDIGEENLHQLLRSAASSATERFTDKGVHLELALDSSATHGVQVEVDPQRFGQVMDNLLSNALRHTPAGGKVVIACELLANRCALITVTDSGDGLSAEQLSKVFERFYRGDTSRSRDRSGSGIGLTISRALIEAHGGTLTADSAGLGTGSVFSIKLPLR